MIAMRQGFESSARGLKLETIAANVKSSERYGYMHNAEVPCQKEGTPFEYIHEVGFRLEAGCWEHKDKNARKHSSVVRVGCTSYHRIPACRFPRKRALSCVLSSALVGTRANLVLECSSISPTRSYLSTLLNGFFYRSSYQHLARVKVHYSACHLQVMLVKLATPSHRPFIPLCVSGLSSHPPEHCALIVPHPEGPRGTVGL